jgi:type I restriction enzyme S subunit
MAEGERIVEVVEPMRSNALPAVSEPIEPVIEPKVCPFSVRAHWLTKDDCRLDASFYADEVVAARRVIEDSGFEIKMLGDISVTKEIFNLSRFKRIYTNDPTKGYPYLSASEVLMFRPQSDRWIACDKAPKQAGRYFAKEGWLLVTCSGAVGRCVLVTKRLERFFLTHDLLRIIPSLPAGYLYAYLSSWIGQALMVKEQYGMTVTHLEPQHLARLPVPLLPDDEQQAIHEQIMQAYRLRDEANDLLDKADELLHAELGLPRFDESQVPYLFGSSKPKAFTVRATELEGRLDASFHIPIARAVIEQLRKGKYPPVRLGDVAISIFIPPRFKRIYVSPEYGVPFLQGSHVPMIKPYDLKYLSRRANERHIEECLIREGWVLVTRSGTVGRLTLVPKALDGWAASEHCLRIVPNPERVHAGYLAAFLMTPYGQHQLTSKIYGGVVDELTEEDTAAIWLPDAPLEVQRRIGTLVVQAFERKEEANAIEDRAIARLENILARGKSSIMPSRKGDAA